jgi:hypothetical protein
MFGGVAMYRIAEKSNWLEDKKILRLSSSCFIKAYKPIKVGSVNSLKSLSTHDLCILIINGEFIEFTLNERVCK